MDADAILDTDKMSSLDYELISNIPRPSLISLTSDDSLDEEDEQMTNVIHLRTASPLKSDMNIGHCASNDSAAGEDDIFKMPPRYTSTKRFSLSSIPDNQCTYNVNKSTSMLDVSSLMSFIPLRRDSYMYSNETLQSNSIATTKSKDSGFQRSTSCTSLTTTSSKKYDHVQSKVKQYIQTIKQTEALRKVQKRLDSTRYRGEPLESSSLESADTSPVSTDTPISKKDLLNKVKELREELKEKECFIEQLAKNEAELRLKYAAAENRIDDLRIRASLHEEPMRNYMTDEKVAELLLSNAAQSSSRYENSITKQLAKSENREKTLLDLSQLQPPSVSSCSLESQPLKKFRGSSISKNYELRSALRQEGISKSSSCRQITATDSKYELSKSASNIDRPSMYRPLKSDVANLPYDKNSFAKVQQWQRSLINLDQANNDRVNPYCSPADEVGCGFDDDENQLKKSRRYQKNKDADKKRYRQSYPVGCKCDKFKKCKSKEDLNVSVPAMPSCSPLASGGGRKFRRTVSFASYEESLTSSMYDDGESSSDPDSEVLVPRHESYKDYKQRKWQEKFVKHSRDSVPTWSEIKKAKSAGNIHRDNVSPAHRNKRGMEQNAPYENHTCGDRKHCSKMHSKKYRKLDDYSKVASSSCHAAKCKSGGGAPSAHVFRSSTGYELDGRMQKACVSHSKSFGEYGRRCEAKDLGRHQLEKLDCSCLLALENLKLQEHNILAKFADNTRRHPRRMKERDAIY